MHNNELLSVHLRKHWGKFVWTLFDQTRKRAQKILCKKMNCQESLPNSKFKAWIQLKVIMKIPELSQKSLFDIHVNGIIYYSQYMNNSKNHFLHLLFQVVSLSIRDMFQLDQFRVHQKWPHGSTPFYRGLLINIYNIISFWVQYPTSIYFNRFWSFILVFGY